MIKLEQQQQQKNQQFKTIENAFNKFSSFQVNNKKNTLKNNNEQASTKKINDDNNITKFSQVVYLLFTYSIAIFQFNKLILTLFLNYLIGFVFKTEKIITNEIVLITGAGGYLGENLALEFAKRGAILVLWDISDEGLKKTSETLKSYGFNRFHLFALDLSNEQQLKNTARQVKTQVGDVSIVIMAAAARFKPKSILELDYKNDVEKQFLVSYMSNVWLLQEFLQNMIDKNHGHLVTVSSSTSFLECSLVTHYCSFKLAQVKLLETVREELLANSIKGIKTTAVYLGLLKGGMANDFSDMYEFSMDMSVTAEYAAQRIVQGVLKDKHVVTAPRADRFLLIFKNLIPPQALHLMYSKIVKINAKYLKL